MTIMAKQFAPRPGVYRCIGLGHTKHFNKGDEISRCADCDNLVLYFPTDNNLTMKKVYLGEKEYTSTEKFPVPGESFNLLWESGASGTFTVTEAHLHNGPYGKAPLLTLEDAGPVDPNLSTYKVGAHI